MREPRVKHPKHLGERVRCLEERMRGLHLTPHEYALLEEAVARMREEEARVREAREEELTEEEIRERREKGEREKATRFFENELRRLIPKEKFEEELAKRLVTEEMGLARELLHSPEAPRIKVERLLDKGMLLEVTPEGHRQIFTREKAALHGALCADGHLSRYHVALCEQDQTVRAVFAKRLEGIYGIKAHDYPKRNKVVGCGKAVVDDLARYGPLGTYGWRVPIRYLDEEGARMWLRGFFTGDGGPYVGKVPKRDAVGATSANRLGLEEVQSLLDKCFGIKSHLRLHRATKNQFDGYELRIFSKNIKRFRDEIGFDSLEKQRKLDFIARRRGSRGREVRRSWAQREVERARRCIRPDVRELLQRLESDPSVERTQYGRIRLRGQPREVRYTFREEARRLQGMGWGYKILARALDVPQGTVGHWFYGRKLH